MALLAFAGAVFAFQYHLRAARAAVEKGHTPSAIRHLRWCQRFLPDHREVLILSARVTRRSGASDEADAILNRYWALYGDEEAVVFERLLLRATQGEIESTGSALLARIAQGGPEARLAREALIVGLIHRFRWGEAKLFLDSWLKDSPDDTLALLQAGRFAENQLAIEQAMQHYRRILELDPEQHDARLRLATLLVNQRFGEEAATELAVLRRHLPENPEILVQSAKAAALLGRTDESRATLDTCLRLHPDFAAALHERGSLALVDGDEAAAENYLEQAARLDPGNTQIRNQYALALGRNGKRAEAAREHAAIKQLTEDADRIDHLVRGPLQTRPNDPAIHHEIAMIALRSGLVKEALRWFTSALQVNPDYYSTHVALAALYRELENPALAARHRAIAQRLAVTQKKP